MLKNIKIYTLLLITLGFMACSNDNEVEPLFDQDVDSRVDALLENYKKTLTDSEFGWKLVYQPNNSVGFYNIFLDFNTDNTVEIVSDHALGAQDLETTYRVGKAHFPELVFENYSTFHNLFEINGFNLKAEFEFIFQKVEADRIEFRSKTDTDEDDITIVVFEKATQGEKERVTNARDSYEEIALGHDSNRFLRNIIVTDPNAAPTDPPLFHGTFAYAESARVGVITTFDQSTGNITSTNYPIAGTDVGFNFGTALQVNGLDISTFTFDEATNTFVSTDGGLNTVIGYDLAPVATGPVPALFSTDVDAFDTRFPRYLYFDDTSQFYLQRTSPDFLHLLKSVNAFGLDIRMNQFGAGVHGIEFRGVSGPNGPLTAAFNFTKTPGEKLTLTFLGATDPVDDVVSVLLLLIDAGGWYIQETDESTFASNPSFQLTSVNFPNFRFSVYGI